MIMPMALDDVTFPGSGLNRPECLVTHESGWIFAADWEGAGGIACIAPDGAVTRLQARRPADAPLRPNGIAVEPGGTFLAAHLGPETRGLFRVHPDGTCEPLLLTLGDERLPPCNFPMRDRKGRIWLTVSTRKVPRALDSRPDAESGFIVLIERRLRNVSSLSFGGPLMQEAYLGCLLGDRIARFSAPAGGLPLPAYTMPLGTLAKEVLR